jgi:hypothetical protein
MTSKKTSRIQNYSESYQRVIHKDCQENPKHKKARGDTMVTNTINNFTSGNLEESEKDSSSVSLAQK